MEKRRDETDNMKTIGDSVYNENLIECTDNLEIT